MPTFSDSVAAVATRIFIERNPRRTWAQTHPMLQILAAKDINAYRDEKFAQIRPLGQTADKAEAWKWPVSVSAPSNGGSYARGGTFNYALENRRIAGTANVKFYQQPVAIASSDVDVFMPARDSETGVAYLVHELNESKHRLLDLIATALVTPSPPPPSNEIEPIIELVDSTGTASGINQATEASWASREVDKAGAPLTIAEIRREIRELRARKMAKVDVIFCGFGVWSLLAAEAEAKSLPMFDLAQVFGTDPKTGEPRLFLESSFSVVKIEGAPVIPDPFLDTAQPGTVLALSLDDIFIYTVGDTMFRVLGWKDVRLEAAVDQTRALILWNGFTGVFNRATHIKWINCATS